MHRFETLDYHIGDCVPAATLDQAAARTADSAPLCADPVAAFGRTDADARVFR